MSHVSIPNFSQAIPVRDAYAIAQSNAVVARMPAADAAWARHVKSRRAVRANPTPACIRAAETAWNGVLDAAAAIIDGPAPKTVAGCRCLAEAISMSFEQCLDRNDEVHEALRTLLTSVMYTLGAVPPEGHEGL